MYAFIRGKVALIAENSLALDVGGVGYRILAPQRVLESAVQGEELLLYTHLIVREDELTLYGFASQQEKGMFERLIGISGIGPKAALSVLSFMTPGEIAMAAISGDTKAFSRVSGIGPKMAGRIVLEMKDKVEMPQPQQLAGEAAPTGQVDAPVQEAAEALMTLGYQRGEALAAVSAVQELADTAEELILLALKRLSM